MNVNIIGDKVSGKLAALFILQEYKNLSPTVTLYDTAQHLPPGLALSNDFSQLLKKLRISEPIFTQYTGACPLLGIEYSLTRGVSGRDEPYIFPFSINNLKFSQIELHQHLLKHNLDASNIRYNELNIAACLAKKGRFTPASGKANSAFADIQYGFSLQTQSLESLLARELEEKAFEEKPYQDNLSAEPDLTIEIDTHTSHLQESAKFFQSNEITPKVISRFEAYQKNFKKVIEGNGWRYEAEKTPKDIAVTNKELKKLEAEKHQRNIKIPLFSETLLFGQFTLLIAGLYHLESAISDVGFNKKSIKSINAHILKTATELAEIETLHFYSMEKIDKEEISHTTGDVIALFEKIGKISKKAPKLLHEDSWIHLLYALNFKPDAGNLAITRQNQEESTQIVLSIKRLMQEASEKPMPIQHFLKQFN